LRKARPGLPMIDHSAFIKMLADRFPEVVEAINEYEDGLLHCEVAVFRRTAEEAMDTGRLWNVEQYFRFVEEVLPNADNAVANAIEVSFLEDFAIGEYTEQRHRALRDRVSKALREKIVAINECWR
jgi:hypothetical protein